MRNIRALFRILTGIMLLTCQTGIATPQSSREQENDR